MADTLDTLTLTVNQAAATLQCSATWVRHMIAEGTIPTLPGFGRRTLISRAWLTHWVETANEQPSVQSTVDAGRSGDRVPAGRVGPLSKRGEAAACTDPLTNLQDATEPGLAHRASVA